MTIIVLLLCALLLPGCEEESPSHSSGTAILSCSDLAPPAFLQSKLDDDDGDGKPIDEDFPTINDEDDDIADHAWVIDETGLFHLFFHNEGGAAGSDIEHYTSKDLQSLDYVGVALRKNPGAWDADGLWAPHIVRRGDTYFMFYTGLEGRGPTGKQRIGLAVSRDLVHWTRYPANRCPGTTGDGCVYECDECWTTWSGSNDSFNQQCRDPFVMWDEPGRRWILLATAKSTNQYGAVTAASSIDLIHWRGTGYIDATRRLAAGIGGQTTGGQAENPFIAVHDQTYFLLFTDFNDREDSLGVVDPRTIVQYATSGTLATDTLGSANWIYRGYIPDPGVNAIEVLQLRGGISIMTQSISNPRSGNHPAHRRELRLKCIVWGNGTDFDTSNVEFPRSAGTAATLLGVDPSGGKR